jgi:ribosomal protein S11
VLCLGIFTPEKKDQEIAAGMLLGIAVAEAIKAENYHNAPLAIHVPDFLSKYPVHISAFFNDTIITTISFDGQVQKH